jgi:hypothetical protein
MQDFTGNFRPIDTADAANGIKYGIRLNGDLGPQVSEFVGHLSGDGVAGVHVGAKLMTRDARHGLNIEDSLSGGTAALNPSGDSPLRSETQLLGELDLPSRPIASQ